MYENPRSPQYGNHFFDEFQFQVGAGFGVLYCNPRGSSGYSEQWGRAVRWPGCAHDPGSGWGGVDFEDVMACVDEACRRFDWVDAERIGILGGSYGGFMTSWAIGHTERFKAACSERACNNLLSMEHSADIAGFLRSYVGVSYLDDPDAYLRYSPVSYIRDMTTPLLIVHSEDDLRCPINQAEELFVGLRLLGRDPELVRFPGENLELSRSGAPRPGSCGHNCSWNGLLLGWGVRANRHRDTGPRGRTPVDNVRNLLEPSPSPLTTPDGASHRPPLNILGLGIRPSWGAADPDQTQLVQSAVLGRDGAAREVNSAGFPRPPRPAGRRVARTTSTAASCPG